MLRGTGGIAFSLGCNTESRGILGAWTVVTTPPLKSKILNQILLHPGDIFELLTVI